MNVAHTLFISFSFPKAVFGRSPAWVTAMHPHSTGLTRPENTFYFDILDLNHSTS